MVWPRERGRTIVRRHDCTARVSFLIRTDQHLSKVGSARIGQKQLCPHVGSGVIERFGNEIEHGLL